MSESARGHSTDLHQRIRAARRELGESIIAAARLTPEHTMVWGQFADAPARVRQTGIYGTTAAVTMLAARGRDMTSTACLLPGVTEPPPGEFDVSDLLITHKVSAIVAALCAVRYGPTPTTAACRTLLSGMVDQQWWGHHVVLGEPQAPSVLATAHALIALVDVEGMDGRLLDGPASWLGSRILDDGPLGMLDLAYAVIALARLRRAGIGPEDTEAVRQGAIALRSWLRRTHARPVVNEQIHYWVPKPVEQRNHYMTFPLQVVVGTALLMSGPDRRSRAVLRDLAGRAVSKLIFSSGSCASLCEAGGRSARGMRAGAAL